MEPANGCRICMRILSGSGKAPWVWSTEGSLVATLWSPPASPRHPTTGTAERKLLGSRWDRRYSGVSASGLHTVLRRKRTIASFRPGLNLKKEASYGGEYCGAL